MYPVCFVRGSIPDAGKSRFKHSLMHQEERRPRVVREASLNSSRGNPSKDTNVALLGFLFKVFKMPTHKNLRFLFDTPQLNLRWL